MQSWLLHSLDRESKSPLVEMKTTEVIHCLHFVDRVDAVVLSVKDNRASQ